MGASNNSLLYLNKRIIKLITILILFINQLLLIAFILFEERRHRQLTEFILEQIRLEYSRELINIREEARQHNADGKP